MANLIYRDYVQISPDVLKKVHSGKFVGDTLEEGSILYNKGQPLLVTFAATHAGRLTLKNALYQPRRMFDAKDSFITPVKKPVLLSHDWQADPLGRVQAVDYVPLNYDFLSVDPSIINQVKTFDLLDYLKDSGLLFDKTFQGLGYLRLTARITNKDAIEKILDERYLTFSTGCSVSDHFCSICDYKSLRDEECEHIPGGEYDGIRCFAVTDKLHYVEVSVAHVPADEIAKVEEVQSDTSTEITEYGTPILTKDFILNIEEDSFMDKDEKNEVQEDLDKDTNESKDIAPEVDLDEIIDSPEAIYEQMEIILDEMLEAGEIEEDAKLSTKSRKSLKSSQFCGPNRSFPVNDCAHVTAALRLLGKAKVSESTKTRIKACVERKAKSLGCGTSKDTAYLWLKNDAEKTIERLSDFDLSSLVEMISSKAEERGMDKLPLFAEVTEKLQTVNDLENSNKQLDSVITTQQDEVTKLSGALKRITSYTRNLVKVINGNTSFKATDEIFLTDEEVTIDQCLSDLEQMASDTKLTESLESILDGFTGKTIKETVNDPTADSDLVVENNVQYNDNLIETAKTVYHQVKEKEGIMEANRYLQRLKVLRQIPNDFSIEEDK